MSRNLRRGMGEICIYLGERHSKQKGTCVRLVRLQGLCTCEVQQSGECGWSELDGV